VNTVITSQRRRIDVDEYFRMAKAGILQPKELVEHIDGELLRMTPIGSRHGYAVDRLTRLFNARLPEELGRVSTR
jgi:Uma2 family endonuclease